MAPRTDEKILENRIASLQDMYVNDESLRKKHLAGRLRESYEVYSEIALEEHRKKYGDVPAVLVGKHFTWGLIDIASRYGLDISDYLGMCLANNPEKPGEVFLKEFGKIYTGMESDLKRIAEELSGEKGKKDYIVWLHEQSAAKGRQGETHISIFSPKEICETGDFDRLFKLTCEYIASLAESSTDNTDS